MSNLFQERYRELPAFQRLCEILNAGIEAGLSIEELATWTLMASENGLNWDTLCQNCGVLMDDNYAQHCEIEQLRERILSLEEDLAYTENQIIDLDEALSAYELADEVNRHYGF